MAFENKDYWTEKRIAAFEKTKEARMQGLKNANERTRGKPASPKRLAALQKLADSRRGTSISEEHKARSTEGVRRKYAEDPTYLQHVTEANRKMTSSEGYRARMGEVVQERYQDPEYAERFKAAINRPEVREANAQKQRGRKHTKEHNQKIAQGTSISQKKRWGRTSIEERRKHTVPARLASMEMQISGLEVQIKGLLDALGVEYVQQFQIGDAVHVDFYIPSRNLVVEIMGCYWHGCLQCGYDYPEKRNADMRRQYFIRNQGYNLYMIWEHDIKYSAEVLVDLLN